ncbi:hypothetical protein DL96DRAFT_1562623 [Flagelloscypha sp. PMI_526]|nr:hypothetical protein DL96DRAFT_1562623 [Flagelloscypha sp. PMI_526]
MFRSFFLPAVMSASRLPFELLEKVINLLDDDLSALAACSHVCSALLPTCRAIRFHTVTLLAVQRRTDTFNFSPLCSVFCDILESSPVIARYVRRVHLLNPEDFMVKEGTGNQTKSIGTLLGVLKKFDHATDLAIFSIPGEFHGIFWDECYKILTGIESLPALRTITVENWSRFSKLTNCSSIERITGLALFSYNGDSSYHVFDHLAPGSLLRLTTFRLASVNNIPDLETFFSCKLIQCLELSVVRHLALGGLTDKISLGSWLGAIITRCATTIETLVLDLYKATDEFDCYSNESSYAWRMWLNALLQHCPKNGNFEVVLNMGSPVSRELDDLLHQWLFPWQELNVHRIHQSDLKFWTAFYSL